MRIGIIAPSTPILPDDAEAVRAIAALGYPEVELVFDPQCFVVHGHFAGADAVRREALVAMANRPDIDAIWFARGGYGSNRILDMAMPQLGPAARHKTYIGFSDMGFMLGALYARRIGRQAHGAMASAIGQNDKGVDAGWVLGWLIDGRRDGLEPTLDGRPAAAFNLAILSAMIGTPWLPDLTDHVLHIEEVSEPLYRIDRMLFQMAHATQLQGIAGVRLGAVTDVVDNDVPFGESIEQMVVRWCREMGVPYLGRSGIGHIALNRVVPFGVA